MQKTAAIRVMEQCASVKALRKEAGLGSLLGRGARALRAAPKVFGLGVAGGGVGGLAASQVPVKAPLAWAKTKLHELTKPEAAPQPAKTDWAGMAKEYGPWAAGGGVLAALAYLATQRD